MKALVRWQEQFCGDRNESVYHALRESETSAKGWTKGKQLDNPEAEAT